MSQVWGEEGWGPEEAKPKLGQNQVQQGEVGCAKEEESPSREQQESDSQLDTSWNNEEERDGKEEGSNVENGNEVDINNVLKVEKADIGMKERLELATGLEVVISWGVFRFFPSITGVPIYHSTPWSLPLSCWKVVPK